MNVLETPSTWTSRRKAQSALEQQQSGTNVIEDGEKDKIVGQGQNNLLQTPATHTSRRRAAAASSRKGADSQQRVYSTRRSVRLLEKTMGELSLKEKEEINIDEIDKDMIKEESLDVSGIFLFCSLYRFCHFFSVAVKMKGQRAIFNPLLFL